jgi:hypothetical protein
VTGRWSPEQVLALAPDAASAGAARRLTGPGSWSGTGSAEELVWGLCAGSGSKPYQTVVDVSGPAYRCSCPSRKFPCKHALALLLDWAAGAVPTAAEPAEFAAVWQQSRLARVGAPPRPRGERDEAAAARRAEQRESRVAAGLAELDTWLRDQVRAGLTAAGHGHTTRITARMVDAQAPGVAGTLRRLGAVPLSGEGWPALLLAGYAQLHLLVRAHERVAELPAELAAVVRSRVGYPVAKEAVLATEAVADRWLVIGMGDDYDGAVPARRIWLLGERTGRHALLLLFEPNGMFGRLPGGELAPGVAVDTDLHFYPGAPLRALQGTRHADPVRGEEPTGVDVAALLAAVAAALAADPWLTEWPAVVAGTPVPDGDDRWLLVDAAGRTLPLLPLGDGVWTLAAVSGGGPVTVAGEWTPDGLVPLTTWHRGLAVRL